MQFQQTMTATEDQPTAARQSLSKQTKTRIAVFGAVAVLSVAAVVWPKPQSSPQVVVATVPSRTNQAPDAEDAAKAPDQDAQGSQEATTTALPFLTEDDPILVELAPDSVDDSHQNIAPEVSVDASEQRQAELIRQAEEFAAGLETAVLEDDLDKLREHIDWLAIIKKASVGLPLEPAVIDSFADQLMSGLKGQGLDERILDLVSQGGSYRFLRARLDEDAPRVMFRLLTPEGGFNYHEFHLESAGDGLIATDAWIALSGETLSASIHRSMLSLFKVHPMKDGTELTDRDREYIQNLWRLQQISTLMRTKPEDALHVIRQLPLSVQKDKNILLARLTAAQAVGAEEYIDSLNVYRTAFPDDAASELVSIDFHVLSRDYTSALGCIDRLDQLIGGDKYLDLLRSGVHLAAGDTVASISTCQQAVVAEPSLPHAYWSLVQISLQRREHALTASLLTHLESRLGEKLGDLRGAPEFRKFVESPEYEIWQEARLTQ